MIDVRACLWPFVDQMMRASSAGFFFPALITALTLPDMVSALESENGRASGPKYRDWVRKYVSGYSTDKEAADLYGYRCSLLHQGSAMPHGGTYPIAFAVPGTDGVVFHNLSTQIGDDKKQRIGWMSLPDFVEDIARAVDEWIAQVGDTNRVQRNIEKFVRIRPEGLPPHVTGRPVVA